MIIPFSSPSYSSFFRHCIFSSLLLLKLFSNLGSEYSASLRSCQKCSAGTFSPAGIACLPAPAGFYIPGKGATTFLPCRPGTFSTAGATTCTSCSGGLHTSLPASTKCIACAEGLSSIDKIYCITYVFLLVFLSFIHHISIVNIIFSYSDVPPVHTVQVVKLVSKLYPDISFQILEPTFKLLALTEASQCQQEVLLVKLALA